VPQAKSPHRSPPPRQLEGSINIVESALQQVRSLSLDLRPSLLDDLGLPAALRWFLDRQAQRTGISARFVAEAFETRLPAPVETVCFRVAQEALTNIARHAGASEVQLTLRRLPEAVYLSVADNGAGFEVSAVRAQARRGESLGLLSMEERVRLAGGELDIRSTLGVGTEVIITIPTKT
jgi:signal transduction histidine kinase